MKTFAFKKMEKWNGAYQIVHFDDRFTEDCTLIREYHRATGYSGYVGHVPGGFCWDVFLETKGEYAMNISNSFKTKKEAIEYLKGI